MKFRTILNNNIRYLIDNQGYKLFPLSKQLSVSRATLTNYYYDKAIPSTDFLIKFAEKFNVSIDDLLHLDMSSDNYVAENNPIYNVSNDDKLLLKEKEIDLLNREIKLKDREIDIFSKELGIYKRIANDCEKHQQLMQLQIKELEKKLGAAGLLSGKKHK